MIQPPQKFIHFKGEVITLTQSFDDRLWRTPDGTIWAFRDDTFSVDKTDRPGVGFFSWKKWWLWYDELTEAAKIHDFQYSSGAYQAFHTRKEADDELQASIDFIARKKNMPTMRLLAKPFRFLARTFGKMFWENKTTNK